MKTQRAQEGFCFIFPSPSTPIFIFYCSLNSHRIGTQGDGDSIARFYIKVRVLPATITCHQPYGTTFQTLRFMANETACSHAKLKAGLPCGAPG
jgi:hypothetical protein